MRCFSAPGSSIAVPPWLSSTMYSIRGDLVDHMTGREQSPAGTGQNRKVQTQKEIDERLVARPANFSKKGNQTRRNFAENSGI